MTKFEISSLIYFSLYMYNIKGIITLYRSNDIDIFFKCIHQFIYALCIINVSSKRDEKLHSLIYNRKNIIFSQNQNFYSLV